MSFFRKGQTATSTPTPEERESAPVVQPPPQAASAAPQQLFKGSQVDLAAIYQGAKLSAEQLDRVVRGEQLLHLLPGSASQTREVVDATFRAFGVDRTKIVEAASKQADALERFIAYSQEQTQRELDTTGKRIAELESEIERCRQAAEQATNEGQQRARTVNNELAKVQRVLDFFSDDGAPLMPADLEDDAPAPDMPKHEPAAAAKPAPPARPA